MKDFDLLTCMNLDSAINLNRNGKKLLLAQKINLKVLSFLSLEKFLPHMPEKHMVGKYWIHW